MRLWVPCNAESGEVQQRDLRRGSAEEAAVSCSSAVAQQPEEPALRPASSALRAARLARAAAAALTDGEASLTAESMLSAEVDSVDSAAGVGAAHAPADGAAAHVESGGGSGGSGLPPPFLFGRSLASGGGAAASVAESAEHMRALSAQVTSQLMELSALGAGDFPGNSSGSTASALSPQAVASAISAMSENASSTVAELAEHMEAVKPGNGGSDSGGSYASFPADPDFNALLEDIATRPLGAGNATGQAPGTPPPPVGEGASLSPGKDSASSAGTSPARKGAGGKLRANPMRGFLSRRLPMPQTREHEESAPPLPAMQPPPAAEQVQLPVETEQPAMEQPAACPDPDPPQAHAADAQVLDGLEDCRHAPQEDAAMLREADGREALSLALGWLRGQCGSGAGARDMLPAEAAFKWVASLLPGEEQIHSLCHH